MSSLRVSGGLSFVKCLLRHTSGSAGESRNLLALPQALRVGLCTPGLFPGPNACVHASVYIISPLRGWRWGPLRQACVLRGAGFASGAAGQEAAASTREFTIPRGFDSRHPPRVLVLQAVVPPVKRSSFVPKPRLELMQEAEETACLAAAAGMVPVPFQRAASGAWAAGSAAAGDSLQGEQQQQQQQVDAAAASAVIRVRRVDRELFFSKGQPQKFRLLQLSCSRVSPQLESICAFLRSNPCKYVLISCSSSSSSSSGGCEAALSQQQQERLEALFSLAVSAAHGSAVSGVRTAEEEIAAVEVLDRTQLVLEIFARRASDRLARLQVALACTKRLVALLGGEGARRSQLSRVLRSLANQGAEAPWLSHFQASVQQGADPRRSLKELRKLQRTLQSKLALEKQQRLQLAPNREGLPVVGLVGYSSSGKTALLNRLCACNEPSGPSLCMTLGVVQRRARLGGPRGTPFLLLDSMGFVEGVAAAALAIVEEGLKEVAARSSLLLLLVDPLHPRWRQRREHALRLILSTRLSMKPLTRAHGNAPHAAPTRAAESSPERLSIQPSAPPETTSSNSNNSSSSSSSNSSSGSSSSRGVLGFAALEAEDAALTAAVHAHFGGRLLEVWTKADRIKSDFQWEALRKNMPNHALPISSSDGTGIEELSRVLKVAFEELEGLVEAVVVFPHETAGSLLPYLHSRAHVVPSSLTETQGRLSVRVVASRHLLAKTVARFSDLRMQLPAAAAAAGAACGSVRDDEE
ncbi:hypothetical protein Esti_000372 [Eimeria stiedai]